MKFQVLKAEPTPIAVLNGGSDSSFKQLIRVWYDVQSYSIVLVGVADYAQDREVCLTPDLPESRGMILGLPL